MASRQHKGSQQIVSGLKDIVDAPRDASFSSSAAIAATSRSRVSFSVMARRAGNTVPSPSASTPVREPTGTTR